MVILNHSKSSRANNLRNGFLLLKAMLLGLFVFFTANLKGAQENGSGFADLRQDLEHLMNSCSTERDADKINQLPGTVSMRWEAQLPLLAPLLPGRRRV